MIQRSLRAAMLAVCMLAPHGPVEAGDGALRIPVLYIEAPFDRPPVFSNQVGHPDDEGLRGAELGLQDNNTTGRFLEQTFELQTLKAEAGDDVIAVARMSLAGGGKLVILNAPETMVNAIADLDEARDDLLFNVGAYATNLRDADCRANVLHSLPSRAMLTDALMQFLAKRRWTELMLIKGNRSGDTAYAASLKSSARKFGLKFAIEKQWLADADLRRNAAQEVPVFTQGSEYDAVVVADEDDDFGPYVMYNTWLPRPIVGTAGIESAAWAPAAEQWGATQLQDRFHVLADRTMTDVDYAAWAAMRSIGEAATRTKSADPAELRAFLLSEQFSLAGFKGTRMSYRAWDGQLRQPILLAHPQAIVATAPLEGFLHRVNELDTLGIDEPESQCRRMM